ncbi:hypothetical protein D3C76_1435200 [compost metagenome]
MTGSRRHGSIRKPFTGDCGSATKPTSKAPSASFFKVSWEVSTATCTSIAGWRWLNVSNACGSNCAMAPVEAPSRTRPANP